MSQNFINSLDINQFSMDLSIERDIVHVYIYVTVQKKLPKCNYSGICQEKSYPEACIITPESRILVKTKRNQLNSRTSIRTCVN